jgi:GDP-L-fucose synthase
MGKIFVAGHRGLVGSAIIRALIRSGVREQDILIRSHKELDLTDTQSTKLFLSRGDIDQVYLCAAFVGGVLANNTYPGQFIYENLMIQTNVIDGAASAGIKKLLFLGSNCIYPTDAQQPIKEESLMTGPLEPTNEPYAIAKIAGIKMCESYNREFKTDYRTVLPCNLYGLNDNYHPEGGHITAGMIRTFHEAKITGSSTVTVWGTGRPRREFLYCDDLADACLLVMNTEKSVWHSRAGVDPRCNMVNVGSGGDHTVEDFARLIARVVGFDGKFGINFDTTKPDGVFSKLSDSSRIRALGWEPKVNLYDGLRWAYLDYLQRHSS